MSNIKDYAVRATAANGTVRAFACTAKELVKTAVEIHGCSPVAAAALGRLSIAGAMMGTMMLQNDTDKLTLTIKSQADIKNIIVVADAHGNVKADISNPVVENYTKDGGKKLDVGRALWPGMLNVIKDLGMKEPYIGQVPLITAEIAEDLTEYFLSSEQISSVVALGVLTEKEKIVDCAGGMIVQLMPDVEESTIQYIEDYFKEPFSISAKLKEGKTPEEIIEEVLGGLEVQILEQHDVRYNCDCSRERFERGLMSIGKKDLQEILDTDNEAEVVCHFCHKKYMFGAEDLKGIIEEL